MFISAFVMWTKFKNKLLKSRTHRPTKTGSPSTTSEWDEVFRPEPGSGKDDRSTRSVPERSRRKSIRNGFFLFGRKKEEASSGSGNVDRKNKKTKGNDVTVVVSSDATPKTGSRTTVRRQSMDRKPLLGGNGNGESVEDDDRVTSSAEVESPETRPPRETPGNSTDRPSFADYPVWIHRVWDEDGDEGKDTTPAAAAAGDPQVSNGVSTFLERSGHDPLTANCAAAPTRASPPRLKRRKKPVPGPDSRATQPDEGAVSGTTPEVQVASSRVVTPSPITCRDGGSSEFHDDDFGVRLERSLDELTSAGNGNEEEEEEEGEGEGGGLGTVEGGFDWRGFYGPEPSSGAGLTTKQSPDFASSSSDEGKESGYVTLEDLQAQLAGGSSSSSSSWSNNNVVVRGGTIGQTGNPLRRPEPTSTVRSLDAVSAVRRPIPASGCHSATWCGGSASAADGGGKKMTSDDDVIASSSSSFLKFTFTVRLESKMFRRRTSDSSMAKYRCTGTKGRELVGCDDLADPVVADSCDPVSGHQDPPQSKNKNDDVVPVDASPKPFACCSACGQAFNDDATMTSDESVAMTTTRSLFPVTGGLRDVNRTTVAAEARKFSRKQQTGSSSRLPLSELHDNVMSRRPEPEMVCFDDDDDGFYLRPLSTTETPKRRRNFDEIKKNLDEEEEMTHMTWDEVLAEAKSLGIHLHPPPSRSPSVLSTSRRDLCGSSSCDVLGTRTGSESAASGSRARKSGSSKSSSSVRVRCSGAANKENRRDDVTGCRRTGSGMRSSTSHPPPSPSPPPRDVGSIQRRRLPPPPSSPEVEEEEEEDDSRSAFSTRSRDYYLDDGGGGGGGGSISWWGGWGCRGCAEVDHHHHHHRRRMCVCSSVSVGSSVGSLVSRCSSSVAVATPFFPSDDGHRTPDNGLVSSVRRQTRNQDFLLGACLEQLQNCSWYWGPLSFEEAEERLTNRPDGTFLVRDSSDERYLLSLSFTSLQSTHHTRIEHYKGMFSFHSQPLTSNHSATSIVDFIENAMLASRGGHCLYYLRPRGPGQPPTPVRLLHPLSRFRCMYSLQRLSKFAVLRHVKLDLVDRLPVSPRLKEYLKNSH